MRFAFLVLICACKFSPNGAQQGDGQPPGEASVLFPPPDAAPDGNDAMESAARRKAIAFTANVKGTNADFPVWIDVTSADLAARAHANDIYFTDADGTTKLDRQVMAFDQASGHLQAWVRVPSLKSNSKIYLYYGDAGAPNGANPTGVFKAHFKAVWHLEEVGATLAETTNQTATTGAFTAATTAITAQLGKGLKWTDSNDQATFTNMLKGNTPHTISVWALQPAVTHTSSILNLGMPMQGKARWLYSHYGAATWAIGYYADDFVANQSLEDNAWHLLAWTLEGSNGVTHLYRDGDEIAGSPQTLQNINTDGDTGVIGHAPEGAATYGTHNGLEGAIDELRIADVARDGNWVKTEYNNQFNPNGFWVLGAEELPPF